MSNQTAFFEGYFLSAKKSLPQCVQESVVYGDTNVDFVDGIAAHCLGFLPYHLLRFIKKLVDPLSVCSKCMQ